MKEEPAPTLQSQHQMDHDNACDLTCYEHDERLRLFCETDMTLVCVICRDGKDHQGHQFKPVNEVAPKKKDEVKNVLGLLTSESTELNDLVILQTAEMQNTKMKSKHLSEQISAQFEMMHKFLTKKKEEIKKHLEMEEMRLVKQMEEKKTKLETSLKEVKRDQEMFKTALDISKPDIFMQWWCEKGLPVTKKVNKKDMLTFDEEDDTLLLKETDFMVIPDSLSLGPYGSHLQFFVWKEMLESINPVAECFAISPHTPLIVSSDGLSVRHEDMDIGHKRLPQNDVVYAEETFTKGQHYWEVEVGEKPEWSLGAEKKIEKANFLARFMSRKMQISKVELQLNPDKGYILLCNNTETPVLTDISEKPRRIGLYLDCERNQVLFYNGDNMTLIHTFTCNFQWPWSIFMCPGSYLSGKNRAPMSVCCYRPQNATKKY